MSDQKKKRSAGLPALMMLALCILPGTSNPARATSLDGAGRIVVVPYVVARTGTLRVLGLEGTIPNPPTALVDCYLGARGDQGLTVTGAGWRPQPRSRAW